MLLLLSALFIASVAFQCTYSLRTTKDWANPIVIFSGIHLTHNWIQTLFYSLSEDFALGGVLVNITDDMVIENMTRNFIAQWVFFGTYLVIKKSHRQPDAYKFWHIKNETSLAPIIIPYTLMTVILIALTTQGIGISEDQALTGADAFNALVGVLTIRSFFWIYALINTALNQKFSFLLITIPIEVMLAGNARKILLMGLLCWLFAFTYAKVKSRHEVRLSKFAWRGFLMITPAYALLLIMGLKRDAAGENTDLITAASHEWARIQSSPFRLFSPLCATDSESLQIWCSELIKSGELSLMYGKTYLQAAINMIYLRPFQGEIANWQGAYAFKMVAYPNVSDHGWDFSFVAESYLNWGLYGYVASFIAFSAIFTALYDRISKSLFNQNLYFAFSAICFVCFRTDSTSLIRYLSYYLVVSLYAHFFFTKSTKITNKNENPVRLLWN